MLYELILSILLATFCVVTAAFVAFEVAVLIYFSSGKIAFQIQASEASCCWAAEEVRTERDLLAALARLIMYWSWIRRFTHF